MMISLSLILELLVLLPVLYARSVPMGKVPYTFIDFNHILETNGWYNDISIREQEAPDKMISLTKYYPITTTSDNDGNSVGVFECSNENNKYLSAFSPGVTYSAFSLEVIVKIRSFDVTFPGYIIGVEFTGDNTQGDAISFNAMTGITSGESDHESNTFFAANQAQPGWRATNDYFKSTKKFTDLKVDTFYHVIVSQDSSGIVQVYVNGAQYGDSYNAPGGIKTNQMEYLMLSLCGDGISKPNLVGIDASIRAFGFYREAFIYDHDAYFCCLRAGMTDCDGIPVITTASPTPEPTPAPVEACVYGVNYFVEGCFAEITGDPHFRTFNGEYHDFQGRPGQQTYYMHPCPEKSRKQMPFALLGRHYQYKTSTVTVLDYITFELYDEGGDKYYIWLSASIQSYAKADTNHPSSLYDMNPDPGTNLASQQQLVLGKRFKFVMNLNTQSPITAAFTLTIRDDCTVTGFIREQGLFAGGRHRMHYLVVNPPQCYKCYTCGLFGDFQRGPLPRPHGVLRGCSGEAVYFKDDDYLNPRTYDYQGWTWEKSYFERTCSQHFASLPQRRLLNDIDFGAVYEFIVEPDFTIINPCNAIIKPQVTQACQTARDQQAQCCTKIGGSFCDKLQANCAFDACLAITADGFSTSTLAQQVDNLFVNPIALVCNIDDIESKNNEDNYIETPGQTVTLPPTRAPVTYIGTCPCAILSSDTSTCTNGNKKIRVSCSEENLSFDETTDAIRSCIDISSAVVPNDITITNLIVSTKFSHTYVGDLEANLQHNLVKSQLFDECYTSGVRCNANNVDVIFDDDAGVNGGTCDSTNYCNQLAGGTQFGIGGIRKSVEPLSRFDGEQANGRYSLFIYDRVSNDNGVFGTWSLDITLSRCPGEQQVAVPIANSNDYENENKYENNNNKIINDNNNNDNPDPLYKYKKKTINNHKNPMEYKENNYKFAFDNNQDHNNDNNNYNNLWQMVEINLLSSIVTVVFVLCICYVIYRNCSNSNVEYAGVKYDEESIMK